MFMIKNIAVILILSTLSVSNTIAQKVTINGYITDEATGEPLIGATIYDKGLQKGTSANTFGYYSLTFDAGQQLNLSYSYVGYTGKVVSVKPQKDTLLSIKLLSSEMLEEVEIIGKKEPKISEEVQMSSMTIPIEQMKNIPVLLGERDIMKVLQLTPGVKSGGEGNSGIYVRGGGPDQNLILLDGVPVYNASHLFGFFSVFNPDAINSVQLIKGGFPARYGGRISSVIDIRMKEGNTEKLKGEGSIGIISSKFTLEGPIKKGKSSFIISARRTYIDILAKPFIKMAMRRTAGEGKNTFGYYFYDVNAKFNHKFSDKSRLYFSVYTGKDRAYVKTSTEYNYNNEKYRSTSNSDLGWGNITSALRWNKIITPKLFSNTTVTYSRYNFGIGTKDKYEAPDYTNENAFEYKSGIYDFGIRNDFDYSLNPDHTLRFGINYIFHTFRPGVQVFEYKSTNSTGIDTTFGAKNIYGNETSVYVEDEFKVGTRLRANVGFHLSNFASNKKKYTIPQPRLAARYMLNDVFSLKASYVIMAQYLHLLTNSTIGLPTDLWVPVTDTIPAQRAHQVAVGFAYDLKKKFEISVEGYYKKMNNLIEYKEGASFFSSTTDWESKLEIGQGWAYGTEFLIQKKEGKLTGWIGYTLSWTNRQFANLNSGEKYPYKYDRRHDVSITAMYKINEKVDISGVWVYGTGNAVTLASSRYFANPYMFGGNNPGYNYFVDIDNFSSRNAYRMPSYHRLDLGINMHKKMKRHERTWSFGVYNAYSRKNPFYIYSSYDNLGNRVFKQISLFPILPSVSYSFKF